MASLDIPSGSNATRRAIVIGAGPAGLMAAEVLARAGVGVTIHERMPNPARKFLLAGRGGLNLTHSEPLEPFLSRYGAARARLEPAIRAFPPDALKAWSEELGVETFVGSSGRIFPKAMKASPLLRAWLAKLGGMGVELVARSRWLGWENGALVLETPEGRRIERPDVAVFALGGASWPRLGSDGSWQAAFSAHGVEIAPLKPSNSGFLISWSGVFKEKFAAQPIKRSRFSFDGHEARGEAIATAYGLEGGAIYALSAHLRDTIEAQGSAALEIDLMPDMSETALATRLSGGAKDSTANRLRKAGLSSAAASLVREDERGASLPSAPGDLARRIKQVRVKLTGVAPIARAISTAGGVSWDSINADYSLKVDPTAFVCGEMLDWEAPTGGYLLQACFATGRAAGLGALKRTGL
ncbi:MAG: TIGR03862 family flavoprotein [Hyphomonadaceae bacterium]|nr:TIGR03862 family flavoprotein [Hyphomonadaceae bacterium]